MSDKVQKLIEELEKENTSNDPFVLIKQIGPEVFENKVVANKEGLLLFGIQFLKAAQFVEENNPEIYVQNDMWWLEDEIVGFKEIEIKQDKMSSIYSTVLKPTWKDRLIQLFFLIITIIIITSFIVGLFTISDWLF